MTWSVSLRGWLSQKKLNFGPFLCVGKLSWIETSFYGFSLNSVFQEDSTKTDSVKQQEATSPCLVDENGETRRTGYAHNDFYRRSQSRSSIVMPKCMPKSILYKSSCQFRVSHMIDRVCRILFPALFAFVNILYWGLVASNWSLSFSHTSIYLNWCFTL